MKKLLSILLALLLCLGCLVPAFAKETTAPAQTTEATQTTGPTQAAEATSAVDEVLLSRWNSFKEFRDWSVYEKAFRVFFADDPDVIVLDHVVYLRATVPADRSHAQEETNYYVIDYFDTDEAEATVTQLRIRSEIDGIPVIIHRWYDSDTVSTPVFGGGENNSVTRVTLDEGFKTVSCFAFRGLKALKTASLPQSLTSIGYGAFRDCTSLKRITLPEKVTSIGMDAFYGCAALKTVEVKGRLEKVDQQAFFGCKKLCDVGFAETLDFIGAYAFAETAIETVRLRADAVLFEVLPSDYGELFGGHFKDCKKLKRVTFFRFGKIRALWTAQPRMFMGCTALESVTLPVQHHMLMLSDQVFSGCKKLKTLKNAERVTEIGRFCFENCKSLERFTVGAKATAVSCDAFKGCKNLKSLTVLSKDKAMFDRSYVGGDMLYPGDEIYDEATGARHYADIDTNFVKTLPKSCTVFVANKTMKQAVKNHGCKGTVKIKVAVDAPKKLKATQKGSAVTLKWSAVKNADGYRLYAVDTKTGALTVLKTVNAPANSLTLKTAGKTFAVKAFRTVDGDRSWSKATTN